MCFESMAAQDGKLDAAGFKAQPSRLEAVQNHASIFWCITWETTSPAFPFRTSASWSSSSRSHWPCDFCRKILTFCCSACLDDDIWKEKDKTRFPQSKFVCRPSFFPWTFLCTRSPPGKSMQLDCIPVVDAVQGGEESATLPQEERVFLSCPCRRRIPVPTGS